MKYRTKSNSASRRPLLLAVATIATLSAMSPVFAVDRYWTDGAGADNSWTTTSNWFNNTPPSTSSPSADNAIFGNGGISTVPVVPDVAQTVLVPGTVVARGLSFSSTGNRNYTFNGDTSAATIRLYGTDDVFNGAGGPFNPIVFNVNLQTSDVSGIGTTGSSTLALNASNATYNGNFTQEDPVDTGRVNLTGSNITLNGENKMSGTASVTNLAAGTYTIGNALAFGDRRVTVTGSPTVSFGVDASFGNTADTTNTAMGLAAGTITLRNSGTGSTERVVTFKSHITGSGSTVSIVANPNNGTGGTNAFRAKLVSNAGYAPTWSTIAGTVIELAGENSTSPLQFVTGLTAQAVFGTSGAGHVEVTKAGLHTASGTWAHTGGTFINAGELRITSAGAMPETGEFFVNSGAYFNVSGKTITVGNLTGGGTIHLSNDEGTVIPGTLTTKLGIAPGSSIGDIDIVGTGTFILGADGTSTFELGDKDVVGDSDQVLMAATANLTLGGTLKILDDGGLEAGNYTLFDLSGGTISGAFAGEVDMPEGYTGTIDTSSGDVVLVVAVPEPGTIAMLGLASIGLLARRRARTAC